MDASLTPAALQQALRSSNPPVVVDVRKRAAFLAAPDMIRGALRRDPEKLAPLPGDNLVVYCVHGHALSRSVAAQIALAGHTARVVRGGIEAWTRAGLPLETREGGAP